MAVAWVLARSADWHSLTSRPTWQRLMDTAGLRRSTVAKYLRLLRDAGLLGLVETGTTPQFRSFLHRQEGNRAAVYVLCVPCPTSPVEETRTPSGSPKESLLTPPHVREDTGEHLAPTREVQRRMPVLSEISTRHLRSVLRPFWRSGWTVSDVLWGCGHIRPGFLDSPEPQVRARTGSAGSRVTRQPGSASATGAHRPLSGTPCTQPVRRSRRPVSGRTPGSRRNPPSPRLSRSRPGCPMHSSRRHRGGSGTSRPGSGSGKLMEYAGTTRERGSAGW